MNKYMRGTSVAALALGLVACVSSAKYKKLEADKAALDAQLAQRQSEVNRLQAEKADLERQKQEMAKASAQTESQYNALLNQLGNEVREGQLKVTQYQNMLSVDVAEQVFFASGSATLKAAGQQVLAKIGEALKSYPDKIIRVVGHTDNVPLSKSSQQRFPSNWELSVIRATNVVKFLQSKGIEPTRLFAVGRGEYSPIAPNDTPEGRQKNRRIEIMLIEKGLMENIQANR